MKSITWQPQKIIPTTFRHKRKVIIPFVYMQTLCWQSIVLFFVLRRVECIHISSTTKRELSFTAKKSWTCHTVLFLINYPKDCFILQMSSKYCVHVYHNWHSTSYRLVSSKSKSDRLKFIMNNPDLKKKVIYYKKLRLLLFLENQFYGIRHPFTWPIRKH